MSVSFKSEKKFFKDFSFNLIQLSAGDSCTMLVFPGAGYNYQGPLLYYPTQWVLEKGGTAIIADYDFRFFDEKAGSSRQDIYEFIAEQ